MPYKYRRLPGSRTYADYTPEKLEECLEAIRSKRMSQREAEAFYKISRATIKRKLKNQHVGKPGHPRVFSDEEELAFASHLNKLCDFGVSCCELDFRFLIKGYLGRQGRTVDLFKNNLPGRDWVKSFLNRHPNLSVRFAANVKRTRAAIDEKIITEFIENVSRLLKDNTSISVENSKYEKEGRKKRASSKTIKRTIQKIKKTLEDSTSEEDDAFSLRSGGDSEITIYNSDEEYVGHLPMNFGQTEAKSAPTPAPLTKDDVEIGNFVLIKWNRKEYPGVVLAVEAEGVEVDCMEPALKAWRWPKDKDVLLYKFEDVVMKIEPPKLIKRGLFSLTGL